MIRGEEEVENK